jgi:hypothetical protein
VARTARVAACYALGPRATTRHYIPTRHRVVSGKPDWHVGVFLQTTRPGALTKGTGIFPRTLKGMEDQVMHRPKLISAGALAALPLVMFVLLDAGCATDKVQAQWSDPQFANHSLHNARVLVVCETSEAAVKRICEEQMSARLSAAGAVPAVPPAGSASLGSNASDPKVLAAARDAGARAVLLSSVAPEVTEINPGPSVGFGVGGFGGMGGYRSGGVGAGVGVTVPVGDPRVDTAYAANMVLADVDTGRVMWTGKVRAAGRQDINQQMATIAGNGVDAAQRAGMF